MTHKHTPGPWECYVDRPCTKDHEQWMLLTNSSRLRLIANIHVPEGDKQALADARLIAAAPELLARLEQALPYLLALAAEGVHTAKPVDMMIDQVRAAIAKARGEA